MRVLIVDDEEPARLRMQRLVEVMSGAEIVGTAQNGADALQKVGALDPDVVFLDIEMPVLNGIEVAAAIGDRSKVVFVTAYDEYAVKAFETSAVDYLVKPVEKERLLATWDRLVKQQPQTRPMILGERVEKIGVRSGQKISALSLKDVSAFLASGDFTEVLCGENRMLVDESLTQIMNRLPAKRFMRIHRSAIVNLEFLSELVREGDRKYLARLNDYFASEVPVSRESLTALRGWLGL